MFGRLLVLAKAGACPPKTRTPVWPWVSRVAITPTVLAAVWAVAMAVPPALVGAARQEGALAGTITDIDGAPLEGVTVTLTRGEARHQTETDASGRYRLVGLVPGLYRARTELASYRLIRHQEVAIIVWPDGLRDWSPGLIRLDAQEPDYFSVLADPSQSRLWPLLRPDGGGTEEEHDRLLQMLEPRVNRWIDSRPFSYSMQVTPRCYCVFRRRYRMRVEGRIGRPVDEGSEYAALLAGSYGTVEQIFEYVLRVIEGRPDRLHVRYDESLGYPKDIDSDPARYVADDELKLAVTGFRPIRQ